MKSINQPGAHSANALMTTEVPMAINRKQIAAATTNAMTWFFVSAETKEPMARNPPAISKLPK